MVNRKLNGNFFVQFLSRKLRVHKRILISAIKNVGNLFKWKRLEALFNDVPRINGQCKLVSVQYRTYVYGLFNSTMNNVSFSGLFLLFIYALQLTNLIILIVEAEIYSLSCFFSVSPALFLYNLI